MLLTYSVFRLWGGRIYLTVFVKEEVGEVLVTIAWILAHGHHIEARTSFDSLGEVPWHISANASVDLEKLPTRLGLEIDDRVAGIVKSNYFLWCDSLSIRGCNRWHYKAKDAHSNVHTFLQSVSMIDLAQRSIEEADGERVVANLPYSPHSATIDSSHHFPIRVYSNIVSHELDCEDGMAL